MTERKTLNRYYPLDYDPAKIPKLKGKQKEQNRLWGIRVMSPFNMRCNTCGDYIYKGKKFNSKKETVIDEDYLGIQIHRFYIRCPKCVAVIAFKTDPENCDYTLETGATRNFEAAKTLLDMEKKKQQAIEDEEAANPMKVLENRTKQSRNEMDTIEALTELREMNSRHEKVDHEGMIKKGQLYKQELERLQKEEEDRLIRELFGSAEEANGDMIRRIESDDEDEEEWTIPIKKSKPDVLNSSANPTDLLTDDSGAQPSNGEKPSTSSVPKRFPHKRPSSTKALLSNLVKIKKPNPATSTVSPKFGPATHVGTATLAPILESDSKSVVTATDNNIVEMGANELQSDSQQNVSKDECDTNSKPVGALGMLGTYNSSDSDSS